MTKAPSQSLLACFLLLCMLFATLISAQISLLDEAPIAGLLSKYFVNGKAIPGVPFEVSDSYAGLMPISAKPDEDKKIFFWWFPSETSVGQDDLVIWLNGGPGCSSLKGLLQENGPFLLPYNTHTPVKNPYSWTKLSNVLWIDQPIGTGFSEGTPTVKDELDVAKQFYGFLEQFMIAFPRLRGKRLWISGESYAGIFIPYMADHILQVGKAKNEANGINYQGFNINDGRFMSEDAGSGLPSVEFAVKYQSVMGLNDSFMLHVQEEAKKQKIDKFIERNIHYPPNGPIAVPADSDSYDIYLEIYYAAYDANPCFNYFNIKDKCPTPMDPLGKPPGGRSSANNFVNNQTGFKQYIHANPNKVWYECTSSNVFATQDGDDPSPPAADTDLLQRVLEQSPAQRNMIQHGMLDFDLLYNGSALALQNTTWNGRQGFQLPSTRQLIVDGKNEGVVQRERGLTFAQITNSGHLIPQDKPSVSFKLQQYFLGQISFEDLQR